MPALPVWFRNIFAVLVVLLAAVPLQAQSPVRARDLGIPFEGIPGPLNAITDVPGVEVGHQTLLRGDGPLVKGQGPVRTGVTAILPRGRTFDPVMAAYYALNGNGEMTGVHWIDESGYVETPITITNTFSVGVVRDAVVAWMDSTRLNADPDGGLWYTYPVVAETYDVLNDILGQHVTRADAFAALNAARGGPVAEGSVGGGTGMIAHDFKAGIGTSSRLLPSGHVLGVLVQANYGGRDRFMVAGVPVGREITDLQPNYDVLARGSIIVVVATDAPLLPQQLQRLAERVPLAIGRMGGLGGNSSGDIFLAFSTGNPGAWGARPQATLAALPNDAVGPLFEATVEATEEAILNAMVAARTMTGRDSLVVHALPHDRLQAALRKYGRYVDPATLPRAAASREGEWDAIVGRYRSDEGDNAIQLVVEDGRLFAEVGPTRLRAVRLVDGRITLLGAGGMFIEVEGTAMRLMRDGTAVGELRKIGD
jgi:L-aminopeptidase/D-esterase-like protein